MREVQLIYASTCADDCTPRVWLDILRQSRKYNAEKGISGILVYDIVYFLQLIEGDREEINNLYKQILNDPRHRDVIIINYEEIQQKSYFRWNMGFVHLADKREHFVADYFPDGDFNPYRLDSQKAKRFLSELAERYESNLDKESE
jgi:hypothetical protein